LNRPVSPLLHDYKQSAPGRPKKSKALQWFAVGLGIPLIAVALISTLDKTTPQIPQTSAPVMMAAADEPPVVPDVDQDAVAEEATALMAMAGPVPEFDQLVLNVASGDTMEKLFRSNNLNLGHLMSIAELDEAKQRFRRIKPGDVFEITHLDGEVMRLYSELSLTSALQINKQESGFSARIVERPIEIRKRMAHGVINSSLFESAAEAGLSDKVIMNIAGIFAWDVDFVLDIRRGDDYFVQFEEIWQDGEYVVLSTTTNTVSTSHRQVTVFAKRSSGHLSTSPESAQTSIRIESTLSSTGFEHTAVLITRPRAALPSRRQATAR